ncbi:MAG: hypothetical protein ACXVX3_15980 [Blastococcus sp.]
MNAVVRVGERVGAEKPLSPPSARCHARRHRIDPASTRSTAMADKSPHETHAKRHGKSIKEKRAERKAKEQMTQSQLERLTHEKKRTG